jgi:hypothetical protein
LPLPEVGLTRDEAIALAMDLPDLPDVQPRSSSAQLEHWADNVHYTNLDPTPEPSRQVWVVNVAYGIPGPTGGEGYVVVLDYLTGEVLALSHWVG